MSAGEGVKGAILYRVVRVSFIQKVTFEQRLEGSTEVTRGNADTWGIGPQLWHPTASPGNLVKTTDCWAPPRVLDSVNLQ